MTRVPHSRQVSRGAVGSPHAEAETRALVPAHHVLAAIGIAAVTAVVAPGLLLSAEVMLEGIAHSQVDRSENSLPFFAVLLLVCIPSALPIAALSVPLILDRFWRTERPVREFAKRGALVAFVAGAILLSVRLMLGAPQLAGYAVALVLAAVGVGTLSGSAVGLYVGWARARPEHG